MEFLSSLCSFIVTAIILIGIPIGVIWLIIAIVKKHSKKMPRNILLGCVAGIVVFSIIGGSAWSGTDDYSEYQAEKEEQESLQALADAEKERKDNTSNNVPTTQTEIETQTESEVETEVVEAESQIDVEQLTEEEYKLMCELITDEEEVPLEEKMYDGQHVKMQVRIGEKYVYEKYDTLGILIDDLIEEYNLERYYYRASVLHTEFSGPTLSVYGEHVYLLFDNASLVSSDDIEQFSDIVIYGEVVQMWSGPFVIPRYIEDVQ